MTLSVEKALWKRQTNWTIKEDGRLKTTYVYFYADCQDNYQYFGSHIGAAKEVIAQALVRPSMIYVRNLFVRSSGEGHMQMVVLVTEISPFKLLFRATFIDPEYIGTSLMPRQLTMSDFNQFFDKNRTVIKFTLRSFEEPNSTAWANRGTHITNNNVIAVEVATSHKKDDFNFVYPELSGFKYKKTYMFGLGEFLPVPQKHYLLKNLFNDTIEIIDLGEQTSMILDFTFTTKLKHQLIEVLE